MTVRRGDWVVTNIHAESGRGSEERYARSQQLRLLSQGHEHATDKIHILIGDFNVKTGEDQCLISEGWRDVWEDSPETDNWTWRAGANHARYDRVYLHSSTTKHAQCTVVERLPNVWGRLTDHVALHVVVRSRPSTSAGTGFRAAPDDLGTEALTTEASAAASSVTENTSRRQSGASAQAEEWSGNIQPRSDIPVISIASKVETEVRGLWHMARLWAEDPVARADVDQQSLTDWKHIPTAARCFRTDRTQLLPLDRATRCRTSLAAKLEQQQKYTKCSAWAAECGLADAEFVSLLDAAPTGSINRSKRGGKDLPSSLRLPNCSVWEHTRLLCVNTSIRTATANAARRLGGEALATQADEEMSQLLSSEGHRISRLVQIPWSWRSDKILCLPTESHRVDSDIKRCGMKCLPGYFEMWLRDQAAALMGWRAQDKWRSIVHQETQAPCPEPQGLSLRHRRLVQQHRLVIRPGEIAPPHFVLDGAICKKETVFFLNQATPIDADPSPPTG